MRREYPLLSLKRTGRFEPGSYEMQLREATLRRFDGSEIREEDVSAWQYYWPESLDTHHSTSPKIFHFDALLTSSGGYL